MCAAAARNGATPRSRRAEGARVEHRGCDFGRDATFWRAGSWRDAARAELAQRARL